MQHNFKRGDIVAKEIGPGQVEYSHLERVDADGEMSAISDETGKPVGLDARRDVLRPATMQEVLDARVRREGRRARLDQPAGAV